MGASGLWQGPHMAHTALGDAARRARYAASGGGACVSTGSGIQHRVQSASELGPLAVRQARGISVLIRLAEATANTITIPVIRPTAPTSADPALNTEVPRQGIQWAQLLTGPWPLLCLLGVQAVLSARLLQSNTAFSDEALYLWAGHLEWAHVLHGMPLPPFATYFSGSPVIYPPIGALADGLGGLAAARALSGCFMLIATILLWSTTARLYGKRAAIHAAGLWAVLGPTLHLGAFATYDAMTLMLLALAASCAVRVAQESAATRWAMAAAGALALANATKYASALWDPVVIATAVSSAWSAHRRKPAIRQAAIVTSYLLILLALLMMLATIANRNYIIGLASTTLARKSGTTGALTVLHDSWSWTGILAITALAGLAVIWWHERDAGRRALAVTLAVAGLLAPLNQARLHTDVSLIKHTDYGAWFAAILAGYVTSKLMTGNWPSRAIAAAAIVASIACSAAVGYPQAQGFYYGWPNATRVLAIARPMIKKTHGPLLLQNPAIFEYYLKIGYQWKEITGQNSIRLPSGRTIDIAPVGSHGIPGPYLAFVRSGYFKVIALNDYGRDPYDGPVIRAISSDPAYVEVGRTPWQDGNFIVWEYRPRRLR